MLIECAICGDAIEDDLFVVCDKCAVPLCQPCYECERKDGLKTCPQCKIRNWRLQGSFRVEGDEEEEGDNGVDKDFPYVDQNSHTQNSGDPSAFGDSRAIKVPPTYGGEGHQVLSNTESITGGSIVQDDEENVGPSHISDCGLNAYLDLAPGGQIPTPFRREGRPHIYRKPQISKADPPALDPSKNYEWYVLTSSRKHLEWQKTLSDKSNQSDQSKDKREKKKISLEFPI